MKKRLWAVLSAAVLTLSLLSGCGTIINTGTETESDADTGSTEGIKATPEFYSQADLSVLEGKKIGITLQSLGNAYWGRYQAGMGRGPGGKRSSGYHAGLQ